MTRFAFIGRRLIFAVPLLITIVLLVFLILQITPGDPVRQIVGLRASAEEMERVRIAMGLDRPVIVQFADYLFGVVRGDLGMSFKSGEAVADMIAARIPVTAGLLGLGLLLSVLISVPVAILTSRRRGGPARAIVSTLEIGGLALPSFWIGIVLVLTIALPTGWFPAGGYGETPVDHFRSLVLPAVTLAITVAPLQIRSLRESILETRDRDFVTLARILGVSPVRMMGRHILRNAAAPSVSMFALNIGFLLFDAVVIESTFALPGIGQGIVLAAKQRDIPAIQGYTLLFAVIVVLVYLIADAVNAALDPRVKVES
ncbi:ABC transporter permease [Brevibacterium casei]